MSYKKLNEQLRFYRESSKLSQDRLSEILHVSRQTVSSWETARNNPDIRTLETLAELYNISIDELLYGRKQSNLSSNEQIGKLLLGIVVGGLIFGRSFIMTSKAMRGWIDVLIVISIALTVAFFKETNKRNITLVSLFESSIILTVIFDPFNMGIEGQMLLVPILLVLLSSIAFFVKDRVLFFYNIRSNRNGRKV